MPASSGEYLLRMAEHIDSDFGDAKHSAQVGQGMQNARGGFELGRQRAKLGAAYRATRSGVRSPPYSTLQCFVHPCHWIIILLIDPGAPLGRIVQQKLLTCSMGSRPQ